MNRAGSNYINTQSGFMVAVGGISSPFSSVKLFRFRLLIWPYNQIVWASLLPLPATVGCCCHLFYYISQSKCLARWLAEASVTATFWSTTRGSTTPQRLLKSAPAALWCSEATFSPLPSHLFQQPTCQQARPKGFLVFLPAVKVQGLPGQLWEQAWDTSTGHPIPLLRLPRSPLASPPQAHCVDHLDFEPNDPE